MEQSSFSDLMQRLQLGDESAAFEVFREYSQRLAGLARTRLQGALAAKVEPDDVLQSVFRSFFLRQREGHFELDGWNSLWSLLTVITLRKCSKQVDYFHAARRHIGRETPARNKDHETFASFQAIARDPTPEESTQLVETIQTILNELSERDREIVSRTLQGDTPDLISEELQCSERTVERVRAKLRARLESMIQSD